jgi:hypothetical protein
MHTLTLGAIVSEDLPIPGTDPWYADPCDPALSVMTDFRERTSITVSENATIDAALEHMAAGLPKRLPCLKFLFVSSGR